ncbi:hypothetical protein AVEN_128294-1 [Araneus ventricosus]|uniref:Uncharacterized protein n=1 Tax=Araneus ventricosus TaxID=182803 RepID=A0A4Y2K1E9_ARAVE|nr:hypothetical protein AVEN_128294-1 [Araneus ventricosus]
MLIAMQSSFGPVIPSFLLLIKLSKQLQCLCDSTVSLVTDIFLECLRETGDERKEKKTRKPFAELFLALTRVHHRRNNCGCRGQHTVTSLPSVRHLYRRGNWPASPRSGARNRLIY